MRAFTLSVATGIRGKSKNNLYGTHSVIQSMDDLGNAVLWDHCAGLFKNDRRGNDNLIQADCLLMDIDNTHTDNPEDWVTPDDLEQRLPEVEFAIIYSRHHLKEKDGDAPRPKFHVYFPLSEPITKAADIRRLKESLRVVVPEFDPAAIDAARFFFGVESPQGGLHEGNMCVDEFVVINGIQPPEASTGTVRDDTVEAEDSEDSKKVITPGERHNTLLHVGFDALTKFSEEKAHNLFLEAAARCKPQKPVDEINRLWTYLVQKRNEFKDKFSPQKKTLTLQIIEQTLQALNISVVFNVINKDIEVSDLPEGNPHVPEGYYSLKAYDRRQANSGILPLFLASYLKEKSFAVSSEFLTAGLAEIARTHPHNPVLDMLTSTAWDGLDRVDKLCEVLGVQDNGYHRAFLRKWLHQAISLALNDEGSISPEFVLVLQGAQGCGKTSFFRRLAVRPDWFSEGTVIDTRDKDSRIEATSVWICELGELDSTLKKEQASLKSFLTSNFDTYRRPYAVKAERAVRRTCFCATVNPETVNRDATGSRRFVYIHVEGIDKDFLFEGMTPDWCVQLWRQVYEQDYLKDPEAFHLDDNERAYSEKNNEDFRVPLPFETELLDLLDWESTDPNDWQWLTSTRIKEMCGLKCEASVIGRALQVICKKYPYSGRRISRGCAEYQVPDLRKNRIYNP